MCVWVGVCVCIYRYIYFIGNCPHDWLFQHVSMVVHHGGAGTTAAGIRAGACVCVLSLSLCVFRVYEEILPDSLR